MPQTLNVHEAKTQLSRLLERVERGEEIVIARAGKPIARLVSVGPARPRVRAFGSMRGQVRFASDYDEADAAVAALFDATVAGQGGAADERR